MSLYPKDKHGLYQVVAEWVESYVGQGGSTVSYFCRQELRRYEDETYRIPYGTPVYREDREWDSCAFQCYMAARGTLMRQALKREKRGAKK